MMVPYPRHLAMCTIVGLVVTLAVVSMVTSTAMTQDGWKVRWYPERPQQGDVVHVVVVAPKHIGQLKGSLCDREVKFFSSGQDPALYHALVGIDYDQRPGSYELRMFFEEETPGMVPLTHVWLPVVKREFAVEHLTLPEHMVTLSPQDQARVEKEQRLFSSVFSEVTSRRLWDGAFIVPVKGTMGSPFGVRRIINHKPRSPHTGQDIKASEGTPVVASNSGRVVLVGSFFFAGTAVCIDHGQGIYTTYFHLLDRCVEQGQTVVKGQVIGWVGATGRAQGPHLHWGVRMMGSRVDPLALLRATEDVTYQAGAQ